MEYLAGTIRHREQKGYDTILICDGDERKGKSTVMIQLARLIDPDFALKNVCFRIENFNRRIHEADKGEIILFDEAGHDLFAKEWWATFQRELIKKLMVIGKKNLTLILVLPHKDDLNSDIRHRRVHFWAHVYTKNLDRGYLEIRKGNVSKWEKKIFWDAFLACHFNKLNDKFWREYEKKKDEFIAEVSSGKREHLGKRETKYKHQRDKLIFELTNGRFNLTQREVAKMLDGLSRSTIADIISEYREKEDQS